jgi:hypothetical protein
MEKLSALPKFQKPPSVFKLLQVLPLLLRLALEA